MSCCRFTNLQGPCYGRNELLYHMTRICSLVALFSAIFFFSESLIAQQPASSNDRLVVRSTGEALIQKYRTFEGAVINMTREEWEVMRQWDQYDESEARRIVAERKKKRNPSDEPPSSKLLTGGCDCWVQPDGSYTTIGTTDWDFTGGAGADVDCSVGPLSLPFDFNFYGTTYTSFYINSKGSISFGDYIIDWTPEEFPGANYNQIAGFWADADYRDSGAIKYKITPEAAYINFINVGYYSHHDELLNSYQIIITPEDGVILPDASNAQLCYLDMNWAHGDVGGTNGCCGGSPATVGADNSQSNGDHIQYGRFNFLDDSYNGPYGADAANQDGVDWLDGKTFNLDLTEGAGNVPPLPSANLGCDTIFLCQNNVFDVSLNFLAPETGQTIAITSNTIPGWNWVAESGEFGTINGTFTGQADNVGTQTILITASDDGSPVATTEVELIVVVSETAVPDLEVSGETVFCSGGETELLASPGFDTYEWSTGCEEQACVHGYGGIFEVTAYLEECSSTIQYELTQTPFFNPIVEHPNALCPGETGWAVVDPDEQPLYDNYVWTPNWEGGGGEVVTDLGPEAELTAGIYELTVTNEEGCQGKRYFNIETIGPFLPEVDFGPYCDVIPDSLVFEGGFSSPQNGPLWVYMQSSSILGWGGGSYLEVYLNGDYDNPIILTSFMAFQQHEIGIEVGDSVEVFFISDGNQNTDILSVTVFNCGSQNSAAFNNMVPGELLYAAEAACTADPATGSWGQNAGPVGSFSVLDEYNTTFYPDGYGEYEICFTDDVCEYALCYEVVIATPPQISLDQTEVFACDGDPVDFTAVLVDPSNTSGIDWSSPGTDGVLTNTYIFNPGVNDDVTVTATNACGSMTATAEVSAQSQPQPQLESSNLCEGGEAVLDPIANDSDDLVYEWTFEGDVTGGDTPTLTAGVTGTYCVNVSNECYPAGIVACAEMLVYVPIAPPLDDYTLECEGNNTLTITASTPAGYTFVWPDGSTESSWTVEDSGPYDGTEICLQYTDPDQCETNESCTYVWLGLPPTNNPVPSPADGTIFLCPEVENFFDLNSDFGGEFSWTITCGDGEEEDIEGNESINLVSSMISYDCWESNPNLTLTGASYNPCAVNGVQTTWNVVVDPCFLNIPNVFTPGNGDSMNPSFQIEGLNRYKDVVFSVFNRWGGVVYESTDFRSGDWLAADLEVGTYWYIMVLPNGQEYHGDVTLFR